MVLMNDENQRKVIKEKINIDQNRIEQSSKQFKALTLPPFIFLPVSRTQTLNLGMLGECSTPVLQPLAIWGCTVVSVIRYYKNKLTYVPAVVIYTRKMFYNYGTAFQGPIL